MSTITTQPSAECRRVAPSNAVLAPSHIDQGRISCVKPENIQLSM